MKKRFVITMAIITAPILLFVIIWGGAMLHTTILTHRYGHIFEAVIMENPETRERVGDAGNLRILSYSATSARIYNVWLNWEGSGINHIEIGGRHGGAIFEFQMRYGEWQFASQGTTWSEVGSADGIVWPYFYHSVEGRMVFGLVAIVTTIILLITGSLVRARLYKSSVMRMNTGF